MIPDCKACLITTLITICILFRTLNSKSYTNSCPKAKNYEPNVYETLAFGAFRFVSSNLNLAVMFRVFAKPPSLFCQFKFSGWFLLLFSGVACFPTLCGCVWTGAGAAAVGSLGLVCKLLCVRLWMGLVSQLASMASTFYRECPKNYVKYPFYSLIKIIFLSFTNLKNPGYKYMSKLHEILNPPLVSVNKNWVGNFISVLRLWVWVLGLGFLVMEKGKGQLSFASMLISDNTNINSTNPKSNYQSDLGNTNSPNVPTQLPNVPTQSPNLLPSTIKPKGSNSKPLKVKPSKQFDPKALFNKLAATRNQAKKQKELTIIGFLVGEQIEFPRLMAKLRTEWRTSKGDLFFSALKAGWFEISFSNHVDFNRVWEGRPYHVFSQLLLLKQWHSGFDPLKESISQLDLWVRLHFLPEEFANSDALQAIIEDNFVGSFIKMDPTHNKNRLNMFTRFCINTDVAINVGKKIIIPDEECNLVRYKLWFDDFPDGCGACGQPDHEFQMCPNRANSTPTLSIKIRKSSSSNFSPSKAVDSSPSGVAWNMVGKNNKMVQNPLTRGNQQVKTYLSENSGVNFVYISDESEESEADPEDLNEVCDKPQTFILCSDESPKVMSDDHKGEMAPKAAMEDKKNRNSGALPLQNPILQPGLNQLNGVDWATKEKNKYEWGNCSKEECLFDVLAEEKLGSVFEELEEGNQDIKQLNYIMDTSLPAETNLPSFAMVEMLQNKNQMEFFSPSSMKIFEEPQAASEAMAIDPPENVEEYAQYEQGDQEEDEYYDEEQEDLIEYEEDQENDEVIPIDVEEHDEISSSPSQPKKSKANITPNNVSAGPMLSDQEIGNCIRGTEADKGERVVTHKL